MELRGWASGGSTLRTAPSKKLRMRHPANGDAWTFDRTQNRVRLTRSGEVGEGGGFGFEGRDGVDQASDGQGIADASGAADETKEAAFTSELDGDADEGGEAGAVDLRNTIEDHNDFSGAAVDYGLQGVVELFAGFPNGEAAVDVEDGRGTAVADVDLHGGVVGHVRGHYTMKRRMGRKGLRAAARSSLFKQLFKPGV